VHPLALELAARTASPPRSRSQTAPSLSGSTLTAPPSSRRSRKDHPEIQVNLETYDGNSGGSDSFHTKISLFDQAGEGWPDVVWSTQVNAASWAAHEQNGVQAYAAPLNLGVGDKTWLDGYTPGALDPVTVDGNIYGARDNLAPVVFWYNKTLFDKFGYEIPTTWEEYEALGNKVAAEHPRVHPRLDRRSLHGRVDRHVERSGPDLPSGRRHILE
jgi:multiple sugar transport system substrate-binding protein